MISFNEKNNQYKSLGRDVTTEYKKKADAIKSALPAGCPDKILLGELLIELWYSNSYATKAKDVVGEFNNALKVNCHSKVFFLVCEKEFALDKSQVSRYMNIVDEFCHNVSDPDKPGKVKKALREEWKIYSFSQLSEMLSLKEDQRKAVDASWSVKRIREYKKSLKPLRRRNNNDVEDPEEFRGLSRKQLIQILLEYKEERRRLAESLERRELSITELLEVENDGQ